MKEIKYRSRVGIWIWCIGLFGLAAMIAVEIANPRSTFIIPTTYFIMFCIFVFGCRYAIDGDTLIVYQYFCPKRYPISKIKSIEIIDKGWITGPALSRKRVGITFTDRNILRSALPLEISPADRDNFIARIKSLNPSVSIKN